MIESQTSRVAALNNRVPTPVLLVELVGASVALALLAVVDNRFHTRPSAHLVMAAT